MSKLIQNCKHFHLVYSNSFNSSIHTSRNSGLPKLTGEENSNESDYLNCLRPAKLNIADTTDSDLAGHPRSTDRVDGIRPEIFKRWNEKPKVDKNREWNKLPYLT